VSRNDYRDRRVTAMRILHAGLEELLVAGVAPSKNDPRDCAGGCAGILHGNIQSDALVP